MGLGCDGDRDIEGSVKKMEREENAMISCFETKIQTDETMLRVFSATLVDMNLLFFLGVACAIAKIRHDTQSIVICTVKRRRHIEIALGFNATATRTFQLDHHRHLSRRLQARTAQSHHAAAYAGGAHSCLARGLAVKVV